MCNFLGNNSCSWIILLVIIWVACSGNNNGCGCGCAANNCGCRLQQRLWLRLLTDLPFQRRPRDFPGGVFLYAVQTSSRRQKAVLFDDCKRGDFQAKGGKATDCGRVVARPLSRTRKTGHSAAGSRMCSYEAMVPSLGKGKHG